MFLCLFFNVPKNIQQVNFCGFCFVFASNLSLNFIVFSFYTISSLFCLFENNVPGKMYEFVIESNRNVCLKYVFLFCCKLGIVYKSSLVCSRFVLVRKLKYCSGVCAWSEVVSHSESWKMLFRFLSPVCKVSVWVLCYTKTHIRFVWVQEFKPLRGHIVIQRSLNSEPEQRTGGKNEDERKEEKRKVERSICWLRLRLCGITSLLIIVFILKIIWERWSEDLRFAHGGQQNTLTHHACLLQSPPVLLLLLPPHSLFFFFFFLSFPIDPLVIVSSPFTYPILSGHINLSPQSFLLSFFLTFKIRLTRRWPLFWPLTWVSQDCHRWFKWENKIQFFFSFLAWKTV